jgi:hypothetical protein
MAISFSALPQEKRKTEFDREGDAGSGMMREDKYSAGKTDRIRSSF